MRLKSSLVFALAIACVPPALAQDRPIPRSVIGGVSATSRLATTPATLHNRFVDDVGVHANYETAFFTVRGGLPGCLYETLYLKLGSHGGRAAYSTVLSAKRSEMALPTITYIVGPDGGCTVDVLTG